MTAVLSLFGVVLLAVIVGLVITRRMDSRVRYGRMSVANDGRGNLRSTITIERAISMVHAHGDTELETRLLEMKFKGVKNLTLTVAEDDALRMVRDRHMIVDAVRRAVDDSPSA